MTVPFVRFLYSALLLQAAHAQVPPAEPGPCAARVHYVSPHPEISMGSLARAETHPEGGFWLLVRDYGQDRVTPGEGPHFAQLRVREDGGISSNRMWIPNGFTSSANHFTLTGGRLLFVEWRENASKVAVNVALRDTADHAIWTRTLDVPSGHFRGVKEAIGGGFLLNIDSTLVRLSADGDSLWTVKLARTLDLRAVALRGGRFAVQTWDYRNPPRYSVLELDGTLGEEQSLQHLLGPEAKVDGGQTLGFIGAPNGGVHVLGPGWRGRLDAEFKLVDFTVGDFPQTAHLLLDSAGSRMLWAKESTPNGLTLGTTDSAGKQITSGPWMGDNASLGRATGLTWVRSSDGHHVLIASGRFDPLNPKLHLYLVHLEFSRRPAFPPRDEWETQVPLDKPFDRVFQAVDPDSGEEVHYGMDLPFSGTPPATFDSLSGVFHVDAGLIKGYEHYRLYAKDPHGCIESYTLTLRPPDTVAAAVNPFSRPGFAIRAGRFLELWIPEGHAASRPLEIVFYRADGPVVRRRKVESLAPGRHTLPWGAMTSGLPRGIYQCRLESRGKPVAGPVRVAWVR